MEPRVIPSINCAYRDLECVERKTRSAADFAPMLHLDIADGAFTYHKSWNNPDAWRGLATGFRFEVHLMVEDPLAAASAWLGAGASRLIVHIETLKGNDFEELSRMVSEKGATLMLASNPETTLSAYEPYFGKISDFLVMGVHPGLSGQNFLPRALEKIAALRARVPDGTIEVDGGVNDKTGLEAIRNGADILVADSFIFSHPNPKGAYEALRSLFTYGSSS